MLVVTVRFVIRSEHVDSFRTAVLKQATDSLNREAACHQFDVCYGIDDDRLVFLYERYGSRAAFDEHLTSDHFRSFDARVKSWVEQKDVELWTSES